MPITEQDIINGYKFVLGREPESEHVLKLYSSIHDLYAFRDILLKSDEFIYKYSHIAHNDKELYTKLVFRLLLNCDPPKRFRVQESETLDHSRILYNILNHSNILHLLSTYDQSLPSIEHEIEEERIIFMHIPKTGGTTIHSILTSHFAENRICPERWNGLGKYKINDLLRYRLFSGHFDFVSCSLIPGYNKKIFTMFRDPIKRLISLYYFQKAHKRQIRDNQNLFLAQIANECNMLEFFQHPSVRSHPSINNTYVLTLNGRIPRGRWEHAPVESVPENICSDHGLLEKAIENLHQLTAFGILEHFDESIIHIFDMLQLPPPSLPVKPQMVLSEIVHADEQLKPVEKEEITEEVLSTLQELTCIDRILYDYALALFKSRIHKYKAVSPSKAD